MYFPIIEVEDSCILNLKFLILKKLKGENFMASKETQVEKKKQIAKNKIRKVNMD